MRNFGIPEPHKPRIDPSEFDDPFFGGEKKEPKPNVYMELGEIAEDRKVTNEAQKLQHGELSPKELAEKLIELDRKMWRDSESEFTQEEMSLVYQIDVDLPDVYEEDGGTTYIRNIAEGIKWRRGYPIYNDDMSDAEIRQLQDYEQVKSLIIERLRSEKYVHQTYEALSQVVLGLGLDPAEYDNKVFTDTLIEKMKDWEERGIFDYLTIELIKNNNRHNIVPIPHDPELGEDQIITLAKLFGINQPHPTMVDDNSKYGMYGHQRFTNKPSVLTGHKPDSGLILLSLMPTKFNAEFGEKTAPEQLTLLNQLQAKYSDLKLHIPSQLEAVAHWYALRATGDKLDNDTAFAKTFVRSIEAEPVELAGKLFVPTSCIDLDGAPDLNGGGTPGDEDPCRIAIM